MRENDLELGDSDNRLGAQIDAALAYALGAKEPNIHDVRLSIAKIYLQRHKFAYCVKC